MNRLLGVLGVLGLLAVSGAAPAQMPQGAIGMPRNVPELAVGTVTVRLIRGVVTEPIVGVPVTLTEDGKPDSTRSARTNNEGRAEFKDLAVGSRWVATATVDEKDLTSQQIAVPAQGGVRVLLSPVPLQMPPMAAPSGGGGDPPMSPKDMRAKARGERTLAPGTLQIRVVHGDWRKPVIGHTIHLVGLAGTGEVLHQEAQTRGDGRVVFDNLRPDVTWYPLSILARGEVDDRMAGAGVTMPPRVGIAMALSGEPEDSGAPPLDDLAAFVADQGAPAGELLVRVRGDDDQLAEVEDIELVDAFTGTTLARAPARPTKRIVTGQFLPNTPKADWPDGRVVIGVLSGTQQRPVAVEGIRVELRPEQGEPIVRTSDDNGAAVYEGLQAGASYTPAVIQFGQSVVGPPFKVPDKNGVVLVSFVNWEDPVKVASLRALPGGNERAYVVRTQAGGRVQLSRPFQLTRALGAVVPLELTPPPEFEFHLAATIDDAKMNFEGQLTMSNGPAAPYTPAGGRLHIPLPRGFTNAAVEEAWSDRVKIDSRGLAWKGALPPGGFQFNVSFKLPIDDGSFTLDMDVPSGAVASSIALEHRAGMQVATLGKSKGTTGSMQGRRFYVISDINVGPQQSLVMKVTGLPQQPRWRTWVRNGVGLGVIALLALGVTAVFMRRGRSSADPALAEREKLLDQLVDLERRFRGGGLVEARYRKQRGRLTQRLEVLFGQGEGKARDRAEGPTAET